MPDSPNRIREAPASASALALAFTCLSGALAFQVQPIEVMGASFGVPCVMCFLFSGNQGKTIICWGSRGKKKQTPMLAVSL